MAMMKSFVGLDLGQAQDYTALSVLQRRARLFDHRFDEKYPVYQIRHLHRFPIGTPYPDIVESVLKLMKSKDLDDSTLVIDQTGVGRAVSDLFRSSFDGHVDGWFCPITITAGHSVTPVECGYHVPKKELVGILQVLLQTQRLKIAKSLPFADILVEEMQNFKVKVTLAANETFGAWREGQHDDMVLSVALAAWLGESHIVYEGPPVAPTVIVPRAWR